MNDFVTLTCPSCGGQLKVGASATSLACEHCGNEHLVRREGDNVMLESYARCPRCGRNDRAEKVTAIRTGQTQQITDMEQRVEVYTDRRGQRQTRTTAVPRQRTQMSDLARRLGPPRKPPAARVTGKGGSSALLVIGIIVTVLGVILTVVGVFPMIATFGASSIEEAITIFLTTGLMCALPPIVLLVVGIVLVVVGARKSKSTKEEHQVRITEIVSRNAEAERVWRRAMDRWKELYYCHRDDCVFIPDEGTCAPLSGMHDYLYQQSGE